MPIVKTKYKSPFFFKNKHIQSIYPKIARKINDIKYERERIYTNDNDFLDLDWAKKSDENVVIIVPGLESSSHSINVKGMVSAFNKRLWSTVVYNPRGLSGEANDKLIQYHAGKTDDFHTAITHIVTTYNYKTIAIIGFSFGGNLVIKYIGENAYTIPGQIYKVACASVPFNLNESAKKLDGTIYFKYFLKKFKRNIKLRMKKFPEQFNLKDWNKIKTFTQYVERFVTPYNEFKSAADYWEQTSCMHFIKNIKIRTLLVNAKDDPFLSDFAFPVKEAEANSNLLLEMPAYGGHSGFVLFNKEKEYYLEKRFTQYIIDDEL